MSYIQTKQHVNFDYVISGRTRYTPPPPGQEGLEHDQITVNQTCNQATAK